MKPFRKIAAGLFGFDRRERRGTYILSVIIIIFLLVRLAAFSPGRGHEDFSKIPPPDELLKSGATEEVASDALFTFDPNTVKYEDLLHLGLSERQAGTLVRYREAGAKFRRPGDLKKVYGIDSAAVARLIPYIIIESKNPDSGSSGSNFLRAADAGPAGGTTLRASEANVRDLATPRASDAFLRDRTSPRASKTGIPPDESPRTGEVPYGDQKRPPRKLIDLNICTAGELVSLPGIGPVLSERIIKYRSLLGGFVDKQQLKEVYGLDTSVVSVIAPMVTLTIDSVEPLLLDSVSFGDLARHPYVGYETARLITRYRTLAGAPLTLGTMVSQEVITPQQAERMAPYVRPSAGAAGNDYEFISSKVLK